ncbi:unnamed protein product [Phytophthora fragariaefolia]|uniref:Unnamed protein product n=1 Tax=Phytophthora fragariaefolia TaxID=1490495 RepID=A0A9W7CNM3_9STRA|nr:unnamed protein product [Phytophthora fragariaefolia]
MSDATNTRTGPAMARRPPSPDSSGDSNDSRPWDSISTWIANVDLAVQGARISGRGDWTDEEVYFVVGNKLQDNAAGWWVQMDQELPMAEKTWTHLKAALIRRYEESPDQAMAEWRCVPANDVPWRDVRRFCSWIAQYDWSGQC